MSTLHFELYYVLIWVLVPPLAVVMCRSSLWTLRKQPVLILPYPSMHCFLCSLSWHGLHHQVDFKHWCDALCSSLICRCVRVLWWKTLCLLGMYPSVWVSTQFPRHMLLLPLIQREIGLSKYPLTWFCGVLSPLMKLEGLSWRGTDRQRERRDSLVMCVSWNKP